MGLPGTEPDVSEEMSDGQGGGVVAFRGAWTGERGGESEDEGLESDEAGDAIVRFSEY
jgi:hypothetical protein